MRTVVRLALLSVVLTAGVGPAAPTPQPDAGRAGLTASPKLRKALDVPVPQVDQAVWSPDGKAFAIRAVEWPEVQTSPQGVQTQGPPKRNLVVVIPDVTAADPRFLTITLPRTGTLVGFTPDGKQVVTDLREYHLVSGFHRLSFWEEGPAPAAGVPPMKLVRTVDLDADQTHGYAFAPDGKTFRTVSREMARPTPRAAGYTRLEVREVSATTGDTLRTPLKVDGVYKAVVLSADGSRLAAVDAETDRLSVWDVGRGEKVSAYDLPAEKEDDQPGNLRFGRTSEVDRPPTLLFAPDGRRVVCFRAPHPTVVLNADKGEPLPALEQADRLAAEGGFSAAGRLLVASGSRVTEERRTIGPGGRVGRGNPGGAGFGNPGGGGFPGGPAGAGFGGQTAIIRSYSSFVGVWDTATGKRLRGWERAAHVVVHPTRPVVAILEKNGEGGVRLGLWDFSAEGSGKK